MLRLLTNTIQHPKSLFFNSTCICTRQLYTYTPLLWLTLLQTLDGHKCSVNRLAWTQTGCQAKHLSDRLTLATADVSGKILVWNVNSGEVKARLQDTANGGVSSSIAGTPTDKTSNRHGVQCSLRLRVYYLNFISYRKTFSSWKIIALLDTGGKSSN